MKCSKAEVKAAHEYKCLLPVAEHKLIGYKRHSRRILNIWRDRGTELKELKKASYATEKPTPQVPVLILSHLLQHLEGFET